MNWVDIAIVIYLAISLIGGAFQGLIRSVLSLIGVIVGVVLAANFYHQFGKILAFIPTGNVRDIIAFIIILVAVMIVAGIVGTALRSVIKAIHLGWVDALGGAVLGVLLGFISVGAFLAIVVKLTGTNLIADSKLSGFILDKFPLVMSFLPSSFDTIRDFFK